MTARIFTIADRPDLGQRLDEVADPWPEFIHHDEVVNARWDELYSRWPALQLVLVDDETEEVLGKGNTMPVEWDGREETLPGGVVEVFEREYRQPNVLSAMVAIIDEKHQGRGLSGTLIQGMARAAASNGFACLLAPVRPTWKDRHPFVPLEEYMRWTREDGLPFDPWIRLHTRLGAEMLTVAPRSLDISGSIADWESWTGMSFPGDGEYVVPGALVPVRFEGGLGCYVEPNVWMRHEPR
jgi:GNAT superfamily N-acetyltransferase